MRFTRFAALIAGAGLLCSCSSNEKSAVGDLAYLDLYGRVTQMWYDGICYNFDENGRLTFPECKEIRGYNSEGHNLVLDFSDGSWDDWSPAKPFRRAYDEKGRLTYIMVGNEDATTISYDENDRVVSEEWDSEGMSGEIKYLRTDNFIKTEYEISREFDEMDEHTLIEYPAYFVDDHGNWTRRFLLVYDSGGLVGRVEEREIKYAPGARGKRGVDSDIVLTGRIGVCNKASICFSKGIGNCDGYYAYDKVCRPIRITCYNTKSHFMTFDAYNRDGGQRLGTFTGNLDENLNLTGIFTNLSGGTAEFFFCGTEHHCDLSEFAVK